MKKILGQKIGMISSFQKNGKLIPVTIISAEPNVVIEVKEKAKHGYDATKIGYLKVQEKSLNKSEIGIYKKAKVEPRKHMKEFRDVTGYQVGNEINVSEFKIGDHVDVQAYTKGHGFTGAIKRWNFKIGPMSHGAGFPHRYQGSISFGRGGSQGQRVMKGKKMSGHYGVELVTIANLEIVDVDLEKNLILIKGSVPGPKNALVLISTTKKVKKFEPAIELVDNSIKKSESNNNVETQVEVANNDLEGQVNNIEKQEIIQEQTIEQINNESLKDESKEGTTSIETSNESSIEENKEESNK